MQNFISIILVIILLEVTFLIFYALRGKNLSVKNTTRKVFIDTSVLIDGRILSIAETGFLGYDLMIPRSVLRELQLLADSSDAEKRSRARFGLDVVNNLERVIKANVQIYADDISGRVKVDERLIELAKEHKGLIMTNDFNLIKVANAEHVDTLNLNDLVLSLRAEHQPGEKIKLKIISEGNNKNQGVGYLKDGTMVVVDNAKRDIGRQLEVKLVRSLQTPAGHMLFAEKTNTRRK